MSTKTSIEWTEHTWNPAVGCTKISAGCAHCYAEVMARRLKAMGVKGYENGFELTLLPERLGEPLKRRQPTTYFVNSMSDLFHEQIPYSYLDKIFSVIRTSPHHNFQILTKRSERMAEYFKGKIPPKNAWLGVTAENRTSGLSRLDDLRTIRASVRFVSVEPLLEDLGEMDLSGVHWVIVGGESGPNARPMSQEWILSIKEQCEHYGCAFFFKQWGSWGIDKIKRNKKANGRLLLGRTWSAYPEASAREG